jgi:hypothetical protein
MDGRSESSELVFDIIHILFWLASRRERQDAERRAGFLKALLSHIDPQFEVELDAVEHGTVQRVVRPAVAENLGQPGSATCLSESVYQRPDNGLVVCGEVRSPNLMEEPVTNFYIVGLSPEMLCEGCEMIYQDPRPKVG